MRNEIHVYHANTDHLADDDTNAIDARFHLGLRPTPEKVMELVQKGYIRYSKVAILKGSGNLDLAYERTNSIHGAWYEDNVGTFQDMTLEKTVPDGVRSSSCGDILVHITDEVTRGYLVATFGFTALPSVDLFGIND